MPGDHRRTIDAEPVVTTKMGTETVVRNATTAVATAVLPLLCVFLPLGVFLPLCMLFRLGLPSFLLLLGAL